MDNIKELYIRVGNSEQTKRILIIGEEASLGSRDLSGYKPSKGQPFIYLTEVDPYSKSKFLTYIHATPNILLDSAYYNSDHRVHEFIKKSCSDLVKWDGETNEGLVRSREAFIVKDGLDVDKVAIELYRRIEKEIHNKGISDVEFEEIKREIIASAEKSLNLAAIKKLVNTSRKLMKLAIMFKNN